MVPSTVKLLHRKKERKTNGDQEGCRLGLKPAPDDSRRVDNSTGKGTSGMDKFDSEIDRMNMKLESKFLNF